jgi:hypothetical protein
MRPSLLLVVLLVASTAAGQSIAPTTGPVPGGWYVTSTGWTQLGDRLTADARRIAELQAINATLEKKIEEVANQPGLTVKSILLFVGVGILIGGSTVLIVKK